MFEYLDRRYALALYEVAEEKKKVQEYLQEFGEIADIITKDKEFMEVLQHPYLSTSRKEALFKDVFKDKIDQEMLSFLFLLIEKDRILEINKIFEELKKIDLEKTGVLLANVKTVIALTEDERQSLILKLENKYNKKVILQEEIDKEIIGGVYVRIGNDVIDGTIKSKFEEIKELTFKTE